MFLQIDKAIPRFLAEYSCYKIYPGNADAGCPSNYGFKSRTVFLQAALSVLDGSGYI
jgi:hypothetical protein